MTNITIEELEKSIQSQKKTLLYFSSKMSGECRFLSDDMAEISGKFKVINLESGQNGNIFGYFNIAPSSVPVFIIFQKGEKIAKLSGMPPKERIVQLMS
jgi:thioredoxin-like negative regulator of GroEL